MTQRALPWWIFIVVLGWVLRLSIISYGLPSKNQALTTYHPDEPKSYYSLERMRREKTLHPGDGLFWGSFHLYSLGATLQAAKMLGVIHPASREYLSEHLAQADRLYLVGRALSLFYGVATLFLLYFCAREIFSSTAAAFATALLSLAPAHVVNSIIVRPDVVMVFWALAAFYAALRLLKNSGQKWVWWAGVFAGLAASSKYNGGAILLSVFAAHFLSAESFSHACKKSLQSACAAAATFFLTCPYALIDFQSLLHYSRMNAGLAQVGSSALIYGPGWKSYWNLFFPLAAGWGATVAAGVGAVALAWTARKPRLLLLVTFALTYLLAAWPKHQMVWYTLPALPYLCLLGAAAWDFLEQKIGCGAAGVAALLVLVVSGGYCAAVVKLYSGPNVREAASAWLAQQVAPRTRIAIARSYFWTPGILRSYRPPFEVLAAGDGQSYLPEAILNLPKILPQARYLVLTDFETRSFLHPVLSEQYAEQKKILSQILSEKVEELAVFEHPMRLGPVTFFKDVYLPEDWVMPAPITRIYRVKN